MMVPSGNGRVPSRYAWIAISGGNVGDEDRGDFLTGLSSSGGHGGDHASQRDHGHQQAREPFHQGSSFTDAVIARMRHLTITHPCSEQA